MADGGSITLRLAVAGAEAARAGLRDLGAAGAEAGRAMEGSYSAATKAAVEAIAKQAQLAAALKEARDAGTVQTRGQASAFGAAFNAEWKAAANSAKEAGEAVDALTGKAQLNRAQMMELQHVARAAFDAIAAGANPLRVASMEGGRLVQALGEGKGGMAGGLSALLGLINPTVIGVLALGGALAFAAKAALDEDAAQGRLAASTHGQGSGATVQQLNDIAGAAQKAGEATRAEALKMEADFNRTGGIGVEMYGRLIAVSKDYAAATGQEVGDAVKQLAAALADPINKGAELEKTLGTLDAAQIEAAKSAAEQGDKARAQAMILDQVATATRGAAAEQDGLIGKLKALSGWLHQTADEWDRYARKIFTGDASADPIERMKNHRAKLAEGVKWEGSDPATDPDVVELDRKIREQEFARQLDADNAKMKREHDARAAQSRALRSDAEALDPKDTKRTHLQGKIDGLLKARADPGMLREMGMSGSQADAAIAAGRKSLADLDKQPKGPKGKSAETLFNEQEAAARKTKGDIERYQQEQLAAAAQTAGARAQQAKSALEAAAADPAIDEKTRKARMDTAQAALAQANAQNDELALELRRIREQADNARYQVDHDPKLSGGKGGQKEQIKQEIDKAQAAQEAAAKAKDDARKEAENSTLTVAAGQLTRQTLQVTASDISRSAQERAAAARQLAALDRAELETRYRELLGDKDGDPEKKRQLRQALNVMEAAKPSADVSAKTDELHRSVLQSTAQQALTAQQRAAVEAELLKLSQQQRTAEVERLASVAEDAADQAQAAGDAKKAAEIRANLLKMRQEEAQLTKAELEALRRQQQSPLEKQQQAIKDKSADPRTQAENNIAGGLNGLSDELVQVTNGTKTFKQALANVAGSIGNSFLKDFYERTITAPLSQASSKLLDKVFGPKQTAEAQQAAATVDLTTKSTTLSSALDTLTSSVQQAASAMGNVGGSGTGGGTLVGGNGDIPGLTGPTGPSFSSFMPSGGGGNDFLAMMMNFGKSIFDKGGNQLLNAAMGGGGGGGGDIGSWLSMLLQFIPGFAGGTDFAPGGPALVGEDGPEYVNLPRGAQVYSNGRTPPPIIAATTRNSANDNRSGAPSVTVNNHTGVQAQAKVSTGADGVTTIDLYRHVMQPAMREAGRSGDLARALKSSPPIVKRRA